MNRHWSTVGLPIDFIAEIDAIARAEDRSKHAVLRRAISLYRETAEHGESPVKIG
ncbi:CopG family ribbon-helix-helix protein [Mycobacterium sp. 94-17]|uniref:CopG family ribbon-helix-helix protein n=1 Tax=Mycobacterium sp. 94-17 TaxID=2986147 RepID=UPI002D1F7A37|nr:ribbon-helix-helix protein, CopG family [Mycobacterium sp. 94-17]MEB4210978.1 ribbon-helix-helix protein, CopG family [Mycobacterium sp. 94-17]